MKEPAEHMSQDLAQYQHHPELAQARTGLAQRQAIERELQTQAGRWRDTISDKLESYRDKRGRKRLSGEYTMHLEFERSSGRAVLGSSAVAAEPLPQLDPVAEQEPALELEDAPVAAADTQNAASAEPETEQTILDDALTSLAESVPPAQAAETSPAPEPRRPRRAPAPKIIEFPRLFAMEPRDLAGEELAESVIDKPRIMDVPEEFDQIELPLSDIRLEPQTPAYATQPRAGEIDTPLQVAAVSQRAFAAIADWVLVLVATGMFAGIVLNMAGGMPNSKLVLGIGLLVPCVFWALYHYLFLVHAAGTPGMHMAQLRLARFSGGATNRHIRRARALAMLLSCASAGLGFGWALVDEDTLCWHDKISRTYLTSR